MDRRTAKREACWLAGGLVRATMEVGWDLSDGHGYTDAEVAKVEAALREVIDELERRGHR